jgi:2-methylcitrate dehydratase PrpD
MDLANELIGQAYAALHSWLDRPITDRLKFGLLDTIAVGIHGGVTPEIRALRQIFAPPSATNNPWVTGTSTTPPTKAFLNALPLTVEQLQDGHRMARGHPFAHLVPSCLAAAEASSASGLTLLEGLFLGYETGVRIGLAMGGTPDGVHDIGTWGTLGATVGCAHILTGGDQDRVAASLRLASTSNTGFDTATVFEGYSGSHIYLATACQLAVQFALAGAHGFEAAPETLERYWLPNASADPTEGLLDWTHSEIVRGYFKLHPTVAHTHGVNDALDQILSELRSVNPDEGLLSSVERVDVYSYRPALQFVNPEPRTVDECRFSIPFTVATAIVYGDLGPMSRFDQALVDPEVLDLARRVQVSEDPIFSARYPLYGRPSRVIIEFTDHTSIEAEQDLPVGDGPDALSHPAILAKSEMLISGIVSDTSWRQLRELVDHLERATAAQISSALGDLQR